MSDSIIAFIPVDPRAVLSDEDEARGVALLEQLYPDAEILVNRGDLVVFRDCGENFASVTCPKCGTDLMEMWQEWMSSDFDGTEFALAPTQLACCGASLTLNDLEYDMLQGFSRWEIALWNTGILLDDGEAGNKLAAVLKVGIREVYRHI